MIQFFLYFEKNIKLLIINTGNMVEYAVKGIAFVPKEGKEILVGHILPIRSRFYQDYIAGKDYVV